jgi:hypothetical protein
MRVSRMMLAAVGIWVVAAGVAPAGEVLPEFAYQQFTVRFVRSDGKPLAGASIYGFCREFNLIWPRNDREVSERISPLWDPSFLATTDNDGTAPVKVPPGRWGFFAAGRTSDGVVIAGWTDFHKRSANERLQIEAAAAKRWTFRRAPSAALNPTTVFLKPEGFPLWLPVQLAGASDAVQMELSTGACRMWGSKDASTASPGFILDLGMLSETDRKFDSARTRLGGPG